MEKYLKGFLFYNKVEPPRIHHLIRLLEACEEILPSFAELRKQCSFINKYAVMPRYPTEIEITEPEVPIAVQYAKEVREFIVKTGVCN